eukprot:2805828-Rhodomonas_salina.3
MIWNTEAAAALGDIMILIAPHVCQWPDSYATACSQGHCFTTQKDLPTRSPVCTRRSFRCDCQEPSLSLRRRLLDSRAPAPGAGSLSLAEALLLARIAQQLCGVAD